MAAVTLARVRRGLHEIRGVSHTRPKYPGGPVCGGRIFAERFPPAKDAETLGGKEVVYTISASWECYCERCGGCDPNGWATLEECLKAAPGFWQA